MLLTLAVVGPAHALKGEVRLEIRTDDPEGRLAPGTTVPTEPAHAGPLTVSRLRFDGSRWFAAFEQARDRTAAEALREHGNHVHNVEACATNLFHVISFECIHSYDI